ncbi:MAG TPA: TetR/AcrR family transcriptional regulator [Jatrophihabitantaceae bacterium]
MLTPRRSDARRNREAILRVADKAFADCPDVVPLDEIARRAGVGRATVYRHFPNRHVLALAVAAQNLDALRSVVGAAEGERRCFRDLLHWVLSTQATMRPLVALIHELPLRDQRRYGRMLIGVLAPPLRRAQADGELRPDLRPADLTAVMAMVNAMVDAVPADRDRDAAVQRLVNVIVDGLSPPSRCGR